MKQKQKQSTTHEKILGKMEITEVQQKREWERERSEKIAE